jgi:DNA-binding transcriptional ArsR family regulator
MKKAKKGSDEELAKRVLHALEHDLRRRIMRVLISGTADSVSPTEASRLLDVPLSSVSYHFRVLAQCGALDIVLEQPVRGSVKHFYRANRAVAEMPTVAGALSAAG